MEQNTLNSGYFKKGNRVWEQRTRVGREKNFATPEILLSVAEGYFAWVDSTPIPEDKVLGSGERVVINHMRPYTIREFCLYCGVSHSWFRNFKAICEQRGDTDFLAIMQEIEDACYTQKFNGAAAGFLNANLIARDLGLVDKQEVENKGNIVLKVDDEDAQLGNAE